MSEKNSLSTFLWVFLILIAAGVAVYLLYPFKQELNEKQLKLQKTKAELHALKKEQNKRQQENQALKTSPAAIEKVAREEFKMVRQGESVIYYPKDAEQKWQERREKEKKMLEQQP
ncbi:MAG: hypothetical protein E7042_06245 [Lentisphaerae bacterium]|nr:hypothetical protein [Lentisphaerota bacterium]